MTTAGDGWALYESGGDGEKSHKRPFQPEVNEEPQKSLQEARQDNSTRVSVEGGNSTSISSTTSELGRTWKLENITRSKIQHPTTMENLPGDLLSNIFIRLLAKQLAQMRAVSKSWNALLSQSSFIKSHLHRSINNKDQILVVFCANASSPFGPVPYTVHPSRFPHPELTNFIKLPESGHNPHMLKVIGSVHGLICSRYGNHVIHIWNPSLSAVSTVPLHSNSMPSGGRYIRSLRFGYDPKTNDYKIVKLTGLKVKGTSPNVAKEWQQVKVYSMRKGSWNFITQRFPSHVTRISHHDCICADGHDGHLHWPGFVSENKFFDTLVVFDLSSETFSVISLPDSILGYTRPKLLGVLRGKLCVYTVLATDGVLEVWVMEEYGVAESWVKHVFSKFVGDVFSLGFISTNEFLIVDGFYRLVLYDPTTHEAKTLENNCHNVIGVSRIVEYVDSLVWVAPTEREMVIGAGQNKNEKIFKYGKELLK